MELPELAAPPPSAEPLADVTIVPDRPVAVGELTLVINAVFTPERVGATTGTTASRLIGRFGDAPLHPGTDYATTELEADMQLSRVRLGRYRWRLTDVTPAPPRAGVVVDRVVAPPQLRGPKLADGDASTFWLSTLGVQELALEPPNRWGGVDYKDYVEIELGAYARRRDEPWYALVRARRVLAGYETAYWELALPLGHERVEPLAVLGDHRIALLAVAWVSESPAELHAHFRLERGTTAAGMTVEKPQPNLFPYIPR